jgi:hypothetical protein
MYRPDVAEIRAEYLRECGPCDYGVMSAGCNCPTGEPRWAIQVLADEVERLRTRKWWHLIWPWSRRYA